MQTWSVSTDGDMSEEAAAGAWMAYRAGDLARRSGGSARFCPIATAVHPTEHQLKRASASAQPRTVAAASSRRS